jgi:predicted N-acetyltransferase YhbS
LEQLGDNLILRQATVADVERVAAFNAVVHGRPELGERNEGTAELVRDLMAGSHPTCQAEDFTVVEDRQSGEIVSSLCLIPQTWTYDGVPLAVGRPELVGTLPAYRNRGLVRAQFGRIHRMAAERGMLVLAITGIPWYYRQFGYEMALDLDAGRLGDAASVPRLAEGEAEPFRIRTATPDDLGFIAATYAYGSKRSLLTCPRDAEELRFEIFGRRPGSDERFVWRVIETPAGEKVGFFVHRPALRRAMLFVGLFELAPGISWAPVTASVVRCLQQTGKEYAWRDGIERFAGYRAWLGVPHPAFAALPTAFPQTWRPYAWFLRVPDVIGFLRRIQPVLERRLADSVLVGHTGELLLSFYRSGVRIAFGAGAIQTIESWRPPSVHDGDARFPDLTFVQVLFGYRTADELEATFPDCQIGGGPTRALLAALFPAQSSSIWGIN